MPPLVVTNGLLVTVTGTNNGTDWANVIGVDTTGPEFMDQATADEIAAAVRTLYSDLATNFHSAWEASACVVADLQSAAAPAFDAAWVPVLGTATSDALAPQFAVCCTHTTGKRGRSYRGRTYLSGATEAWNTADGSIAANFRTAVEDAWVAMRTALLAVGTGQFQHAVVSRTLLETNVVLDTRVDDEWDHQDRRKRT